MAKKDVKNAVKNLLKKSNKYLTQSQIAQKTKIDVLEIVDVLEGFERKGLVVAR